MDNSNERIKKYKIAYCTPSIYIPGGIERVLTTKVNYFADVLGYDIYIILTDGKGKEPFFKLSDRIHLIQLDINFEELWTLPFIKKTIVYLKKQREYKKKLSKVLYVIHPDITVSLLRREINFISDIKDGSRKIGEMHVNRLNYRNFEANDTNAFKKILSFIWMKSLITQVKRLDRLIVLSKDDKNNWPELTNVCVIPNPIGTLSEKFSTLENKNAIAVGRFVYQKGFDLLVKAWNEVNKKHPDWQLTIYGSGDKTAINEQIHNLHLENSCFTHEAVNNISDKYIESSLFVLSSRFEGFGMVLIEAMACGLPCISFDCPTGPSSIVKNGENGFLVKNGDIKSLAEKICFMIENKELRNNLGKQAYLDAKQYEIGNIAKQWNNLFDKIIQKS